MRALIVVEMECPEEDLEATFREAAEACALIPQRVSMHAAIRETAGAVMAIFHGPPFPGPQPKGTCRPACKETTL